MKPAKSRCGSCRAEVYWMTTEKNGKPILVDPSPAALRALANDERFRPGGEIIAHFATCPQASLWRKRGKEQPK